MQELLESFNIVRFDKANNYNLELRYGNDLDSDGEQLTIYDYYIISEEDGIYLSNITNLPVYYINELDLFILGMTYSGIAFSEIFFEV